MENGELSIVRKAVMEFTEIYREYLLMLIEGSALVLLAFALYLIASLVHEAIPPHPWVGYVILLFTMAIEVAGPVMMINREVRAIPHLINLALTLRELRAMLIRRRPWH